MHTCCQRAPLRMRRLGCSDVSAGRGRPQALRALETIAAADDLEASFLFEEIHDRNCYLKTAKLEEGDTVVDIGVRVCIYCGCDMMYISV
jgi:hypothetical protein